MSATTLKISSLGVVVFSGKGVRTKKGCKSEICILCMAEREGNERLSRISLYNSCLTDSFKW